MFLYQTTNYVSTDIERLQKALSNAYDEIYRLRKIEEAAKEYAYVKNLGVFTMKEYKKLEDALK